MIMADVLKITLIILGLHLCFICYWLAAAALFPAAVTRACERYGSSPVRITVSGLLVAILVGGFALVLGNAPHPLAKAISVFIGGVLVLGGLGGSAGLAVRIGAGLASSPGEALSWPWLLRGCVILSLTFLFPVLGWFVVLPWVLVSGLGAAVLGLRERRKTVAPPDADAVVPGEGTMPELEP